MEEEAELALVRANPSHLFQPSHLPPSVPPFPAPQLDQHLQQTNKLAARMTTILARLDTRLKRLDRTIEPFGIQLLSREARSA